MYKIKVDKQNNKIKTITKYKNKNFAFLLFLLKKITNRKNKQESKESERKEGTVTKQCLGRI